MFQCHAGHQATYLTCNDDKELMLTVVALAIATTEICEKLAELACYLRTCRQL